jgi:hypothetical protein
MIKTELVNIKEDKTKSYEIYKPSKINKDKYQIIISSDEKIYIQFILYIKFADNIKIKTKYNEIKYENFPHNGILYSCMLDLNSPLIIKIKPFDLCTKIIIQKKLINPIKSINLNYIKWDNIFIINLPRRTDRKEKIEKLLFESKITKYQFIEAYDGLEPQIINQYNQIKKEKNIPIITAGHFACLLSHIKAIKLAKQLGYKNIMILEDDVFFETDLIKKLSNIQIPNFDLLYLGGIMSKNKLFDTNWAYPNENRIMGAYAYILSSKIFDIVLNDLEKLEEYVDFYYLKYIQTQYKTIILNDIIKTDLTSSDTSNKSRIMIKRLDYIK